MLLTLLVLLTACSQPLPQFARLPNDAVLLAFGDSITHGNGAGPDESYPAVLASLTGLTVINAGYPGEVSGGGRARLPALLDTHQPALLLLCHGGNDLLRKIDPVITRRNLDAMIDMAHARDIQVLLVGVPQPGLFLLESAELYREVATRHGLLYDDNILPDVYSDNALKADQIHPNAAGYRKIAAAIHRLMQDSGLLAGT
jgi:lysophospholipase L1-like esterase